MYALFFTYFSLLVASIILLYIIGFLLFNFLKISLRNTYMDFFAKMMVSLTVCTVGSAIYYTKGITVLVILLPIMVCLFWRVKMDKKIEKNTAPVPTLNLTTIICLFIGVLILFSWRFYQIYNPNGNLPMPPHGDVVFYSNLVDFLVKFGNENSSVDYIKPFGTSPYHYFELWLAALIANSTGLNTGLVLVLEVFSIGPIIIWIGLCAVLGQFKSLTVIDIFFCLFGVFLTGITFDFYTKFNFMQDVGVYASNAINYNKLFPIYLFSICALLFFMNKKNTEAVICLLALPVVFISTAIGLFSALFIWILINFIRTKRIDTTSMLMTLIISFSIFLFYKITPAIHTHVTTNFTSTFFKMSDSKFIRTSFNILVGTTLQFTLLFSPFILIFFIIEKRNLSAVLKNSLLHLFVMIYILSLIGWAFLHESITTVQVFSNMVVVMFNLLAFFILVKVWIADNKFKRYAITFIFIILLIGIKNSTSGTGSKIYYLQQNEYLDKIYNESKRLSLCGSFIYSAEDYKNSNYGYISNFSKPGNYLIYSKNKTFPLSISPFSYTFSTNKDLAAEEYVSLANTPFWQYVSKQQLNKTFESLERSQIQFIEEYKINYLICTKNVTLSKLLQEKIQKGIIDENTGERFYILK